MKKSYLAKAPRCVQKNNASIINKGTTCALGALGKTWLTYRVEDSKSSSLTALCCGKMCLPHV